ncbi:retrovirus-related pol polyprotein from transposon TNT 1-94 [Tanacetum coccineum]
MAAEVLQTLEYRRGQLNAASVLELVKGSQKYNGHQMREKLLTKSTWDDLILYHEGPSDVKESRVMNLKLCYNTFKFKEGETLTQSFTRNKALMNELVNDGIKLSKLEINTSFINGLPKKWLSFWQNLRNTNHVKDSELASLFGKLKYEENLIDSIYETKKEKTLVSATPLSTAFFSTSIVQDFQDSPDDEEDTRSIQEYLNDLEEEYQARALLAKSKRFFKKSTQRFSSAKATDQTECHKCSKKVKAKLALLSSSASASKAVTIKNKGLIAEAYEWDEEEVSSDDNEMVKFKVLMALAEDNDAISKEGARISKWVKISMRKHVNTEILKENKNLRTKLKELTSITKTWLNSSDKVNQCISEQIPSQKKRVLGVDQLTEDPSSSGQKDLVFVKSSADDTKVSIPGVERPWLSEAEGFILPNHDTGRILPAESQRNTTDPSVAVTDSSSTDYDSVDESSVCSTPLPPLKKLDGAEPISGPKTIKSILRSKSTFKAETLKGVIINEPSSAPAKGNKSSSASKVNSAPAGKLKSVKIKDDPPLAIEAHLVPGQWMHKAYNWCQELLHKYVKQPGPKVVFGDDSTCTTEVFTKVAFVNGLKYNLISISQLCDAKYIVQFDEKRGTIFNFNKEVVMIAPRVRDVYVFDMTSSAQESYFFAKASDNLNWLWHKRLAHLNFKTINKLAKQNLVIGLPSLVYSKDKPCSSCEKGKHHRASFKIKHTSFIKKYLHLLHMDLFGHVTPRSINHEKYIFVIVNEYSRVFKTRIQQIENPYHITFVESPDAIKFSKPSVDDINIAETERYTPDEYLHPYEPSQRYQTNRNNVIFIEPYECPEPVVLETKSEHSNHTNDEQIVDNLPNTKDIQIPENLSSPSVKDTSVQNTIPIPNLSLSIPSMVTLAPQDRWSQDKRIELVNIIGNPGAGIFTRAMSKELSAASAHECLFVDFLSEEEPKKVSEALQHPGWVDACFEAVITPTMYAKLDQEHLWTYTSSKESGFDLKGYSDSDYARCNMDRKSTSGKHSPEPQTNTKNIFSEFWYTVKTLQDSKIWVSSLTGGVRGEIGITTFRNALRAHYLSHSNMYVSPLSLAVVRPWFATIGYNREIGAKRTLKKSCLSPRWRLLMAQIIQCLGGKTGGLDQISNKDATILYWLANGLLVDFAKIIWEDIIQKLNKKTKEKVVPCLWLYIFLLGIYDLPEYDMEDLTINPTQLDVPLASKAPNTSSHDEMKDFQDLGELREEGAHPQLSSGMSAFINIKPVHSAFFTFHSESASGNDVSADSTAEANPGKYAPNDSIPHQLGDGLKNGRTNLGTNKESRSNDNLKKIKLEDLSDLIKDTRSAFFTPDSPNDEPIIVTDKSEEEAAEKHEEGHDAFHIEPEDTSASHPLSPKSELIHLIQRKL